MFHTCLFNFNNLCFSYCGSLDNCVRKRRVSIFVDEENSLEIKPNEPAHHF